MDYFGKGFTTICCLLNSDTRYHFHFTDNLRYRLDTESDIDSLQKTYTFLFAIVSRTDIASTQFPTHLKSTMKRQGCENNLPSPSSAKIPRIL